jgi:TatA/E family protein of Tat protein translocase
MPIIIQEVSAYLLEEDKMFGIGMPELIIIMVIALIVIGPSKLPDLAKALGKGMNEFKKATQDIKESLNVEEEFKEAKEDLIDSISGLDDSPEPELTESTKEEMPKYNDFDEMLEDYEKTKSEPREDEKSLSSTDPAKEKNGDG